MTETFIEAFGKRTLMVMSGTGRPSKKRVAEIFDENNITRYSITRLVQGQGFGTSNVKPIRDTLVKLGYAVVADQLPSGPGEQHMTKCRFLPLSLVIIPTRLSRQSSAFPCIHTTSLSPSPPTYRYQGEGCVRSIHGKGYEEDRRAAGRS